ncbi:hypothetical protein C8Q80DRAFT_317141 [Daedaleopsis nitida]|nr:hypothetical protein C8Q80DRAFT_317141 [Daedaleopsis nitida]
MHSPSLSGSHWRHCTLLRTRSSEPSCGVASASLAAHRSGLGTVSVRATPAGGRQNTLPEARVLRAKGCAGGGHHAHCGPRSRAGTRTSVGRASLGRPYASVRGERDGRRALHTGYREPAENVLHGRCLDVPSACFPRPVPGTERAYSKHICPGTSSPMKHDTGIVEWHSGRYCGGLACIPRGRASGTRFQLERAKRCPEIESCSSASSVSCACRSPPRSCAGLH